MTLSDGTALPTWINFDASTRNISGIPTSSDVGTVTVKYIATDGTGQVGSENFVISVTRKPVVDNLIPAQTIRTGQALSYTIPAATFSDGDGDVLTYSATNVPSWATFTPATRLVAGTPTTTDAGQDVITITATDTTAASVSTPFTINVENNIEPVAVNEIPDQSIPVGVAYTYTFAANTFSDANGDAMTYTISGNPSYLGIDSPTRTISGTPTFDFEYNITVTASDPFGGSGSDVFLLVVGSGIPNTAPVAAKTISNQTATATREFSFTMENETFTDADNDTLSYSANQNDGSALPAWLLFTDQTFAGVPAATDLGNITVKVTASDEKGGSASETFEIQVVPFSSSSAGIGIMVFIVIIILVLLLLIVVVVMIIRRRKIEKVRAVESDSSSDDNEDEIIDKTGTLTQFLANTHTLEGSKFIPRRSVGAIYQKKSLEALFAPQETVKKFFKNKYGLEYDQEVNIFKGAPPMRRTAADYFPQENVKEEDDEDEDYEEEKKTPRNMLVKKSQRKKSKKSSSPKSPRSKSPTSTFSKGKKSASTKMKGKSGKALRSKSPKIRSKTKKNLKGSKIAPASPKSMSVKAGNGEGSSPRSQKIKSLKSKSPKAKSPKSPKVKSPKSPKAKSPQSPKAKSPKSPKQKSPRSPKTKSPKSPKGKSPRSPKSPKK